MTINEEREVYLAMKLSGPLTRAEAALFRTPLASLVSQGLVRERPDGGYETIVVPRSDSVTTARATRDNAHDYAPRASRIQGSARPAGRGARNGSQHRDARHTSGRGTQQRVRASQPPARGRRAS